MEARRHAEMTVLLFASLCLRGELAIFRYYADAHNRPVPALRVLPNPVKTGLCTFTNDKTPVKYVFFHSPAGIR
jgi:hypothetical protein